MKILIVEDDELIAQTLENILRDRYYVVDRAAEGLLGWEFVETYDYDLILLDVILPELNGIEFCQKLRSAGNQTPVLLLTAQNSHDNKVIGLDAGADDYVVKPFEVSELLARIRVLLRRRNSLVSKIAQWEKLRLDFNNHEVTYQDKLLSLTPKEYRLLELFLRNSDRVLTREIIFDRIWDVEEAPSENTISAHIKELRRKLKQAGARTDFIETVYGVGYRLKPLAMVESKEPENNQRKLRHQTKQALAGVWQKFEQTHHERLAILERTNQAWQVNTIDNCLLQQAEYTAHKLAGGLGVFGFSQGSNLARKMEELLKIELKSDYPLGTLRERAQKFSELLAALKESLNLGIEPSNPVQNRPVILAVDDQPKLVQQLSTEMAAMNMRYQLFSKHESFEHALNQSNLDAIIWDFSLADWVNETLNNLAQTTKEISLPVILFTDNNNQSKLIKMLEIFRQIWLQKATLDYQAIKVIVKAWQQAQSKTATVLLVDDDPQILEGIKTLLEPHNIKLTTLDNPENFWQAIAKIKPDLLVLDVAMPHFTGIELCQLVRSDSRWQQLPILFFTVHHDLDTIHQILTAGGNDCIHKIASSELIEKIFHHLDRTQLYNRLACN